MQLDHSCTIILPHLSEYKNEESNKASHRTLVRLRLTGSVVADVGSINGDNKAGFPHLDIVVTNDFL